MSRAATAKTLVDQIPMEGGIRRRESKVGRTNGSFQLFLMKQAMIESGHCLDDRSSVVQYYFKDEQMLVIDLTEE